MARNIVRIARRLNVARPICNALLGKNHSAAHRMLVGVAVMVVGVAISKSLGHIDNVVIEAVGDLVGYAVHGLGLTPFIEHLAAETLEEVI